MCRFQIILCLSKQISSDWRRLLQNGGTVTASSAGVGEGSEFVLRLPVLNESRTLGHQDQQWTLSHVNDGLERRVLVVDDNADAAKAIEMILKLSGYEVHCVHDGPAALEAANALRPDVVVLDIGLPGMTGYEVAERLRGQPQFKQLQLIAVTGYGQDADRRRSKEVGIDHHLTKPIDANALQTIVASSF